ncbi:hypothetical protein C8Q80DRAFT_419652 [Daedaleopsis nitida]|nr:hypothetical protein C8Q80DRAFT_419652 [Daedaleopsis nitida]
MAWTVTILRSAAGALGATDTSYAALRTESAAYVTCPARGVKKKPPPGAGCRRPVGACERWEGVQHAQVSPSNSHL